MRVNGRMPDVLNSANEIAVEGFLKSSLSFVNIPRIVEKAMTGHKAISKPTLEDILLADKETRDRLKKDDKL